VVLCQAVAVLGRQSSEVDTFIVAPHIYGASERRLQQSLVADAGRALRYLAAVRSYAAIALSNVGSYGVSQGITGGCSSSLSRYGPFKLEPAGGARS
jgi:hypothetical protein